MAHRMDSFVFLCTNENVYVVHRGYGLAKDNKQIS